MSLSNTAILDSFPGEKELAQLLQQNIQILIGDKIIKQGRLIHFKRLHYVYQLTFFKVRGAREMIELPLPYKVEMYKHDKLIYFDYRNINITHNDEELQECLNNINIGEPLITHNQIVEISFT